MNPDLLRISAQLAKVRADLMELFNNDSRFGLGNVALRNIDHNFLAPAQTILHESTIQKVGAK